MQEQTQQQLLSELEKRLHKIDVKDNMFTTYGDDREKKGRIKELDFCIQLIKSITTNRSSQEPKIKE